MIICDKYAQIGEIRKAYGTISVNAEGQDFHLCKEEFEKAVEYLSAPAVGKSVADKPAGKVTKKRSKKKAAS